MQFSRKERCYYCFAKLEKNIKHCERLSTKYDIESCYVGVAAELAKVGRKEEVNFYGKIREKTQFNMRNECLLYTPSNSL